MIHAPISQRIFISFTAILFVASTALTIAWCASMSAMHEMPMPGGWRMSMMWMRMPGQSWPGAVMAFLGMWLAMTVAMMLPVLLPMLMRYRRAVTSTSAARLDGLTAVVGVAYFVPWALFGIAAFLFGSVLVELEMQWPPLARAVPMAIGAIVLSAGVLQFSAWKTHHLAHCRAMCYAASADAVRVAWQHGLRLGAHCVHCCFGLTVVLLVIGVMDLRAMAVVTAAIAAERLTPGGTHVARAIGFGLVAAGLLQIAKCVVA